ncbi:MAG TPA: DUF3857 and transglutaminase domain-containing protein [Acidobacteriota bacterium]|nr:DUF3857 and transglutaminase domain-containing protein [Acidobacteriota bacterium]
MSITRYLPIALVLALAIPVPAQDSVEEIVRKAPARGKYPDASAIVVRLDQEFRLSDGGTKSEDYSLVLEVFSVRGREKFSDFRIPFDRATDTVNLAYARTYKPDLTPLDVEKGAINDLTPPNLADADMYANIVHRVLSFPAVDPGSCLAVRYSKESRGGSGNLDEVVSFQTDEPVLRKRLRIVVPVGKTLKYRVSGLSAGVTEERTPEGLVYTLEASDSPQIRPEEFMPPREEVASRIVFTTAADWNEATRPFARSFFGALKRSGEAARLAAELTKGAPSGEEKVRRIFLFVAGEIRSVKLDLGEGGTDVHDADTVLGNRYGDWKDKAALLVAMLGAAGFEAHPVLVNAEGVPPAAEVPSLKQFDSVLVAVSGAAGTLFLDPFADDSLYGYFRDGKDSEGLIVCSDSAGLVPVRCLAGTESASSSVIRAELFPDGSIRGKAEVGLSGIFDTLARRDLKDKTARELADFYAESVNKLLGEGEVVSSRQGDVRDLTAKAKFSLDFKGGSYGVFQGDIMLVTIPRLPFGFLELPSVPSLAKRSYPFRASDTSRAEVEVAIVVPAGFEPIYIPPGFEKKLPCGEFRLAASYDKARSVVTIRKGMNIMQREIPVEQYDEFKKTLDAFGILQNTLILLEKAR